MRIGLRATAGCIALLACGEAVAGIPVESAISAVTVYLDRAVVTRTATVDLAAGEQQLVYPKLPATLIDDSLRVTGSGTARITILDVTPNPVWPDKAPNERVRALEEELRARQEDLRALSDRGTILDQQKELVGQIAGGAAAPPAAGKEGAAGPRAGAAEWQQLLEFYRTSLEKIAGEKQANDRARTDLNAKIAALSAELEQLRGAGSARAKSVTVRVNAAEAGRLQLSLTYALADARWRPAYDARVSTADGKVALSYFGMVGQRTGEDWSAVELTLSTAHPAIHGAAPELRPWIVAQAQPLALAKSLAEGGRAYEDRPAARSSGTLAGTRLRMDEEGAALETFSVADQTAQVSAAGAVGSSVTFRIPGSSDIPSGDDPHKIGIAVVPLAAELSFQSTPKVLPAAFVRADVTNGSDYPLLAGPMAVFLDDTFVANGRVKAVMPGEKFNLTLGVDDGIRVERKLINRLTEDLGLISKEIRVNYEFLITVTNNKRVPAVILVKDQVPVSRHEKIEVLQVEPTADAVKPDAQGILGWKLDLKPGEKREIRLKFSVTYPTDLAVTGLE